MEGDSRTINGIRNSSITLILNIFSIIIQFFSRKIFINYLGTEVMGLNTTIVSILQFLNIAELGVGQAISFTLYKPLYEKSNNIVIEIISLQGWIYKRIAIVVIICSSLVMIFFPVFFSKTVLPLWYSYATFGVLLSSVILSYTRWRN